MTPEEKWNQSLTLLRHGDNDGWPSHEWIRTARWDTKHRFELTPAFDRPIWAGQKGIVLINADFGMGDTIHFFRFIARASELATVILRCDSDFSALFDVQTVSFEDAIPDTDFVIHMMALPRLFGLKEFSGTPYLRPKFPSIETFEHFNQLKFTKIGLCGLGNPANPRDKLRSLPVDFKIEIDGLPMFNLVKHVPAPEGMLDVRKYMSDWNDTAHLISCLDLVISVDTAVAHLAGALGVPTWLLLPTFTDWRWGEHGDSTQWYDSMRIIRRDGWDSVIETVNTELLKL